MDKRTLLIFALLITLLVINDLIIWLICKEIYTKSIKQTIYNFYAVEEMTTTMPEKEEINNGSN